MNKKFARIIAIVLVIAISFSTVAFADDTKKEVNPNQTKSSSYIDSYSGKISPQGNGRFNIIFTIVGTGTMTQIGASYIRIYKNGTQVDSFWNTSSGRSGMMGYNTYVHVDTEGYQGVSGAIYYAKITFIAKNSSGSDIKYYTTTSVTV